MDQTSHRRERLAALVRTFADAPEQLIGQILTRAAVAALLVLVVTVAPHIHAARSAYGPWLKQGTEQVDAVVADGIERLKAWDRSLRGKRP